MSSLTSFVKPEGYCGERGCFHKWKPATGFFDKQHRPNNWNSQHSDISRKINQCFLKNR